MSKNEVKSFKKNLSLNLNPVNKTDYSLSKSSNGIDSK